MHHSVPIAALGLLLLSPIPGVAQTPRLADAHFPSRSPDGLQITCNRIQGAQSDADLFAWVVPIAAGAADTLVHDPYGAWFPQWAPDGRHIVYFRSRTDVMPKVYEFVVHDLLGDPAVVWPVPNIWHDAAFNLSPDGKRAVYTVLGGGRQIWTLDLADGTTQFIRAGQGGAISPDNQWIAYTIDGQVAVALLAGGPGTLLEPGYHVCWTPDSQALVFSSNVAGQLDLIWRTVDGSARRQLTADAALDLRSAVSPQGDKVAFVKTLDDDFGPFDLWILDLETMAVRTVKGSEVKRAFR